MVAFNDRRDDCFGPSTSQAARKGISSAVQSGRRVTVQYDDRDVSGYLRKDNDGSLKVFHNSRSTVGKPLQDESVQQIVASRKNRNGSRDAFHTQDTPERWRDMR